MKGCESRWGAKRGRIVQIHQVILIDKGQPTFPLMREKVGSLKSLADHLDIEPLGLEIIDGSISLKLLKSSVDRLEKSRVVL